jgi:hypothetical protein
MLLSAAFRHCGDSTGCMCVSGMSISFGCTFMQHVHQAHASHQRLLRTPARNLLMTGVNSSSPLKYTAHSLIISPPDGTLDAGYLAHSNFCDCGCDFDCDCALDVQQPLPALCHLVLKFQQTRLSLRLPANPHVEFNLVYKTQIHTGKQVVASTPSQLRCMVQWFLCADQAAAPAWHIATTVQAGSNMRTSQPGQ